MNILKLGNAFLDAIPHFRKIAHYPYIEPLKIDQNTTDIKVNSSYDYEIRELSLEIEESKTYYGTKYEQQSNYDRKVKAIKSYN